MNVKKYDFSKSDGSFKNIRTVDETEWVQLCNKYLTELSPDGEVETYHDVRLEPCTTADNINTDHIGGDDLEDPGHSGKRKPGSNMIDKIASRPSKKRLAKNFVDVVSEEDDLVEKAGSCRVG